MIISRIGLLTGGLGLLLGAAGAWAYPTSPCFVATASCRTLSFTDNDAGTIRSAQAIIQVDTAVAGTDLYITLSNITLQDLSSNSEILTSFFWNIKDSLGNYVANWVGTQATTKVVGGSAPFDARLKDMQTGNVTQAPNVGGVDENIGGEWVYKNDTSGGDYLLANLRSGVSTTGLSGTFGSGDPLFCALAACNLDGQDFNVGATRYGLTSLADNPPNGGSGSQQPIVQDTIRFKLHSTTNTAFNLQSAGSLSGAFQYGTNPGEPRFHVPEPSVLCLLGLGGLALIWRRRRSLA